MQIAAVAKTYALARPFRIASLVYVDAPVVEVTIRHGGCVGRGEAAGVDYHGETCATMLDQITWLDAQLDPLHPLTRIALAQMLPPGGARNAVDCALWDVEAKQRGIRVSAAKGQPEAAIRTYITIGLDTPETMARDARAFGPEALIKIKLGGAQDRECLRAVRAAAPDARLIVDANEGWTFDKLLVFENELIANGVWLVEQPLPANADDRLRDYRGDLNLCADESCHDHQSLPALLGKYKFVNIKLDKTGGLTEALLLAEKATALGFRLMVGCMAGSSLGIAPALIVAPLCEVVDLDCPLQLLRDIPQALAFSGHDIGSSDPSLWG